MTNCQSWVVWINLRGHTIQRQATEDGNKSLVLFSMPFCNSLSLYCFMHQRYFRFWGNILFGINLSWKLQLQRLWMQVWRHYAVSVWTEYRRKKMTGRRHSPVTFLFLLPAMSKNPHFFSQRQYFQCAFELPMLFYCCWPTYNLPCQPPPHKKNQPELDPPDRRLPVNIATETLLPPSLPASHWSDAGQAL